MAVETLSAVPTPAIRRPVASLAVLGDSTAVGMGDPMPTGGWRGFGPLLAGALGSPETVHFTNLSVIGARMADLRRRQLPPALALRLDVAVILAGMNDTLRSDFDGAAICDDLDATVTALQASGAMVLITRYHQHGRVFRLPGPLRRALHQRIEQLNHAADHVVADRGALCLDLHLMPGTYETAAGGRQLTAVDHLGWLVFRGLPWLARRSRDLLPHAAGVVLRDLLGRSAAVPSRCVR